MKKEMETDKNENINEKFQAKSVWKHLQIVKALQVTGACNGMLVFKIY